ncbi:MAG: hypothetical protein ACRDKX_03475 [Solirubrobacterales bacterium]
MGAWSYIRRVARDQTGGIEPVAVELERNPGAVVELGAHNPPDVPLFLLRVGIAGGFGRTRAGLPVYRNENPAEHPVLKEIYHCEVAGKILEAANIYALREKVRAQIEVIAPAHSLPLCYFRAPRYDYSLPVYQEQGASTAARLGYASRGAKLVCPVLAGPKLKAEGLAELREPVVRHLRTSGYLTEDEQPEVLVVRPSDLRLVAPAGEIRCLETSSLWIPTVEGSSAEGPVVGLLTQPAEIGTRFRLRRASAPAEPPPSASDITGLLRYLGGELVREGRLINPWTLYATTVRPEIWARTEELTDPTPLYLSAHLEGGATIEMPIRHTAAGESVGALRDRDAGICVFLAGDHDALAAVAGRFLTDAGFLRDPDELHAEEVREAPTETLDPDSIWTQSTDSVLNQEVGTTWPSP